MSCKLKKGDIIRAWDVKEEVKEVWEIAGYQIFLSCHKETEFLTLGLIFDISKSECWENAELMRDSVNRFVDFTIGSVHNSGKSFIAFLVNPEEENIEAFKDEFEKIALKLKEVEKEKVFERHI